MKYLRSNGEIIEIPEYLFRKNEENYSGTSYVARPSNWRELEAKIFYPKKDHSDK